MLQQGKEIGHLGNQRQRAAQSAVSPGLGALRDDDVGTDLDRALDVLHVLALADQLRAGTADSADKWARITEGEHDRCRSVFEHVG